MLSDRQKLILKAITEEYIETNEPVGSKVLTEKPYLDFSSATIRYDMQFLEEEGYLEKTHTSSGRIPSQLGFRFFVDNLTLRDESEEVYKAIDDIFDSGLSKGDTIKKVLELFSELTGYMTVLVGSSVDYSTVKKTEIVPLTKSEAVLLIVTSNGSVQSQKISIPKEANIDDLVKLIEMFDNAMYDRLVMDIRDILSKEASKPRIRKMVDFHDDIINFLIKAFTRFQNIESYQTGLSKMFNEPEFQNPKTMQEILKLVDEEVLSTMLCQNDSTLSIKIGSELDNPNLKQCAIISMPYTVGDDEYGSVGLIGPMRLNYNKVIPLIEYISKSMEKLYNEKE